MRRRIARFIFVTLLAAIATVVGVATALTLSPPGRDLLARTVSSELSRVVNGSVDIGSISGQRHHRIDNLRLVRAVRHRDQDIGRRCPGDPRLHRVQHTAAEVIAQAPQTRQLPTQALDHRHGGVLVEVVDDDDLVRCVDFGRK